VKAEIPEQHILAQGSCDPHVNRMGFIEDIQIEEGLLVENIPVGTGFCQSVFHKPDPFILEVDAGKAFLSAALDDLLLADINAFDKIIALKQGSKEKNPDNEKENTNAVFGKCQ
jgi:hypothetical protein